MATRRIYHWRHGWIPLDKAAFENKMGRGPAPRGSKKGGALTNGDRRAITNMVRRKRGDTPLPPKGRVPRKPDNWVPPKDNKPSWSPPSPDKVKKIIATERKKDVEYTNTGPMSDAEFKQRMADAHERSAARQSALRDTDVVDGVEFVTYKSPIYDPLGSDHGRPHKFTPQQRQVLADAYNEVKTQFPGMKPVQIVGVTGAGGGETFGITGWDGRRISMDAQVFTPAGRQLAADSYGERGAITGQNVGSARKMARAVLTHELGHALQMQTLDARRRGSAIAAERVTYADVGRPMNPVDDIATISGEKMSEVKRERWTIDMLNDQSVYATGNEFEWFAEAFADGFLNKKTTATPQSKRVVAMLHEIYGGPPT